MTVTSVTRNELWRHPDPTSTPMWAFLLRVNSKYGLELADYPSLYKWSIENVAEFWEEVWHFVGVTASEPFDKVLPLNAPMYPRPDFFEGARLNFAENLLFPANVAVDPTAVATITTTELGPSVSTTWAELRDAVRRCSAGLRARGVRPDDIVAGFVSNHVQAIVAALAAASVGAIWTGISPDNGVSAVLDRLAQIGPKVLFADNGTVYNGKEWSSTDKTEEIVRALMRNGLELVVVINNVGCDLAIDGLTATGVVAEEYESFLQSAPDEPLRFEQLPPSHPLYILYSSGTTGLPKAIVHTALGTLIQHKKEHALHGSLTSSSRMLYYTTTSWMMWHWSVSALAVGATLVLYSGSPSSPTATCRSRDSSPTSASPTSAHPPPTSPPLKQTPCTPSTSPASTSRPRGHLLHRQPPPPSTFSFVYKAFPSKVNLASITGGTDIISLFGAPCPSFPRPHLHGPFPCQPLTFFGTGGDAKYEAAYFERFSDVCGVKGAVWHHGDFVKIPNPATGSLVMLGRSDGVLKPAGVRFGSAEIYNILTRFFAAEVEDAVCVGRRRATDADETVCLFIVPAAGHQFDDELRAKIKSVIRRELSPRHVPGVVEECGGGIPKTGNGKKIEVAVKQILSGMDVKTNASVANPEALEWFRAWAATH
ncbi:acetoacetate-CoA ligase [Colletotrichum tofieldiae]|nr:acetoacetate-CoA ligase [Colletotrichum tofieldiae]